LASLHRDEPHFPVLQKLILGIFQPQLKRVGFGDTNTPETKDDATIGLTRSLVLSMLGIAGDTEVETECRNRLDKFCASPSIPIPGDVKGAVFSISAKRGGEAVRNQLLKIYTTTDVQEEKQRVLSTMGGMDGKGKDDKDLLKKKFRIRVFGRSSIEHGGILGSLVYSIVSGTTSFLGLFEINLGFLHWEI